MAGLDDLIGSMTSAKSGGAGGSGDAGGTGLEDILGGILGSGQGSGDQGGGLEDILGGVLGGQGGGGGLGDILGGLLGGGGQSSSGASGGGAGLGGLIAMLAPMIGTLLKNGGLSKILSGMQASGLSAQADSWVATGSNEPIGAADVRQALGEEEVARVADELGIDADQASEVLATILPGLVSTVTPDGQVPADDEVDRFVDAFAGLGLR